MTTKEIKATLETLHSRLVDEVARAEQIHAQLEERADELESWIYEVEDYEDASEALDDTKVTIEALLLQLEQNT